MHTSAILEGNLKGCPHDTWQSAPRCCSCVVVCTVHYAYHIEVWRLLALTTISCSAVFSVDHVCGNDSDALKLNGSE